MLQSKRFPLILALAVALVATLLMVQQSHARSLTAFGVPLSTGGTTVCLEDAFLPDNIYMEVTYSGERQGSTVILRGTGWVFGPVNIDMAYNLADDTWSHNYPFDLGPTHSTEKGYWNDTTGTGDSVFFEFIAPDGPTTSGSATWVLTDCSTLPRARESTATAGRGLNGQATETAAATGIDESITLFGTELSLSGGDVRVCAASTAAQSHIFMDVTYAGEQVDSTVILRGSGRFIDPDPYYYAVAYNLADDTWTHSYSDVLIGDTLMGLEKGYYDDDANVGDTVRVENNGFSGLHQWKIVDCSTLP